MEKLLDIDIRDLEQLTGYIVDGTFEQVLSFFPFPMIGKIKEVVDSSYNRRKEAFEEVGLKWN